MKKTTNTTEEKTTTKTSLLKPFPFVEKEKYLLKLKNDKYVVAYWEMVNLFWTMVQIMKKVLSTKKSKSLIALKDLGL